MNSIVKTHFLEGLSSSDRQRLESAMRPVRLSAGATINDAGLPIASVLFPTTGLLGELVTFGDGRSALARLVGAGGVVGAAVGISDQVSPTRSAALTPVEGNLLDAGAFRVFAKDLPQLRGLVEADVVSASAEAAAIAGCAACHRLEERLAALLLQGRSLSASQRLVITHDLICQALGAQRTTVTTMMRGLKQAGVIRAGRGWLQVLDARELARRSCGCGPAHAASGA